MYLKDMEPTDTIGSIFRITDLAYPTRFSPAARIRHEVALAELGDLAFAPHFSRAVVQGGSKDVGLPEPVGEALALRTTALYQTANAVAANATLFTWSRIAEHLPPEVDVVTELSLSHANPFLFQRVLMAIGVPLQRFDAVPLDQLSRLATEAPQVAAFASWYSDLIRSVAGARGSSPVDAVALDHFARHVEKTLSAQAGRVKLRALVRLIERARLEWVNGLVTAGISYKLGAHPIAAGMAGLRTRRSVSRGRDIILDRLERAMQLELIDFSDVLEEEELVRPSRQQTGHRSSRK